MFPIGNIAVQSLLILPIDWAVLGRVSKDERRATGSTMKP